MLIKYLKDKFGNRFFPFTSDSAVLTPEGNLRTVLAKMKAQRFGELEECSTEFREDGSIIQTYSDRVLTTTFNEDGSITETCTYNSGAILRKTVTFNDDGTISEVVEE